MGENVKKENPPEDPTNPAFSNTRPPKIKREIRPETRVKSESFTPSPNPNLYTSSPSPTLTLTGSPSTVKASPTIHTKLEYPPTTPTQSPPFNTLQPEPCLLPPAAPCNDTLFHPHAPPYLGNLCMHPQHIPPPAYTCTACHAQAFATLTSSQTDITHTGAEFPVCDACGFAADTKGMWVCVCPWMGRQSCANCLFRMLDDMSEARKKAVAEMQTSEGVVCGIEGCGGRVEGGGMRFGVCRYCAGVVNPREWKADGGGG